MNSESLDPDILAAFQRRDAILIKLPDWTLLFGIYPNTIEGLQELHRSYELKLPKPIKIPNRWKPALVAYRLGLPIKAITSPLGRNLFCYAQQQRFSAQNVSHILMEYDPHAKLQIIDNPEKAK